MMLNSGVINSLPLLAPASASSGLYNVSLLATGLATDSITTLTSIVMSVTGTADAADSATIPLVSVFLAETGALAAALATNANMTLAVTDAADAQEALEVALALFVSASAAGSDAVSLAVAPQLIDSLVASDTASSVVVAQTAVAVAAALTDLATTGFTAYLAESGDLADALTALIAVNLAVVATADGADTIADTLTVSAILAETGTVTAAVSSNAVLTALLAEGGTASVALNLGGEDYYGYVVNAETGAVSTYTNFPFNSFAELGVTQFAAADTGLYQLGAATDAGAEIYAKVRSGLMDFGSHFQKRLFSAEMGYTSDGTLVLKAVTNNGGQATENWFKLTAQTADHPREAVIKLGKGLKSMYWQFEFENIDGAAFSLHDVRLFPVQLTRRR